MLLAGAILSGPPPAHGDSSPRPWPINGPVLKEFVVGEYDWSAGHRGIDIGGKAGEPVYSPAAGVVAWTGVINGVAIISIDHPDGIRSTYQPVVTQLVSGAQVSTGQIIGVLADGHCPEQACLHFGTRRGEEYLDPRDWLAVADQVRVRLLPAEAKLSAHPPEMTNINPAVSGMPVAGPITSPFGPRSSPISGLSEFHDGVDIGAPCGEPVVTLRPGRVTFTGEAGGYGLRVEVDHGVVDGMQLGSSYSHLSQIRVIPGQELAAGQVVGLVGTTGWSTGCHLHWSSTVAGQSVDPLAIH